MGGEGPLVQLFKRTQTAFDILQPLAQHVLPTPIDWLAPLSNPAISPWKRAMAPPHRTQDKAWWNPPGAGWGHRSAGERSDC